MSEMRWAIGLMSGTSLDGIDAAMLLTDGESIEQTGASLVSEYDAGFQTQLAEATQNQRNAPAIARELTLRHAIVVKQLLKQAGMHASQVDLIGFHGQTILHQPDKSLTWQMGDGALLAQQTGIDVVCDFRSSDIAAGGQGAPLVPVFQAALLGKLSRPVAVVNIGGISNLTYLGKEEDGANTIIAFDTGPGSVLINQWMQQHTSYSFDPYGEYAQKGTVDQAILSHYMQQDFFNAMPPKSLDRHDFSIDLVEGMSVEDGAATLTAFTYTAIDFSKKFLPAMPQHWYITGGGRLNNAIMNGLKQRLGNVSTIEACGLDGDMLEAQAFAHLAVRSVRGLPLTFPSTTGVPHAVTGGAFYQAGMQGEHSIPQAVW